MSKIDKELVNELGELLNAKIPLSTLSLAVDRYKLNNLSEERFLWDCLWAVPTVISKPWFNKVYALDCKDTHITTALKAWFKTTGLTY